MSKYPFIATYLMASGRNGTLYLGVTSDVRERVRKHKSDAFDGFSKRYGCKTLVWFERHHTMEPAIEMETRMKGWKRRWKLAAIEAENPELAGPVGRLVRRDDQSVAGGSRKPMIRRFRNDGRVSHAPPLTLPVPPSPTKARP